VYHGSDMKAPLFLRELTPAEQQALEAGLRSADGFVVRRCQALLQSRAGYTPRQIQARLGLSDQSVRNAIHAFHAEGLGCLEPKSSRPKSAQKLLPDAALEPLKELLHQSPRSFGQPTSLWTLEGVAQVAVVQGLTPRLVSDETIRDAMKRLKVSWKRAKRWITSPDPAYARKKGQEIG
jgi:transposase